MPLSLCMKCSFVPAYFFCFSFGLASSTGFEAVELNLACYLLFYNWSYLLTVIRTGPPRGIYTGPGVRENRF